MSRQPFSTSASSAAASTTSKKSTDFFLAKGTTVMGMLLFAIAISDPVISSLESSLEEDTNDSYWMEKHRSSEKGREYYAAGEESSTNGIRQAKLRNADKHQPINATVTNGDERSVQTHHALPSYSRIVIVGGGMAGLHTALALAERMNDPNCQDANPPVPSPSNTIDSKSNKPSLQKQTNNTNSMTNHCEIIVLDASQIGNGSSGRAKGLVVPGFQVPLENLQESASDYYNVEGEDDSSSPSSIKRPPSWSVPALLQWAFDTPPYPKATVEKLYDWSYNAMDRLRNIVKLYEIDCDWIESGAVEGSIHHEEADDDDNDAGEEEEDDGCHMLTSEQVNEIMGRHTKSRRSDDDGDGDRGSGVSNNNLYQWGEYDPSCAGVNPLALTIGLANAVESWGVRIYEHVRVIQLEKEKCWSSTTTTSSSSISQQQQPGDEQVQPQQSMLGKYVITTEQGHAIHCDHVVLCTGAETLSKNVSKRLSNSFVPVYTWMAATEPLRENCPLKNGIAERVLSSSSTTTTSKDSNSGNNTTIDKKEKQEKHAPMCGDDHISLNYWRNNNDSDGRLLFGSLANTYSLPQWMIKWRLKNALGEVYPHLCHVGFDCIWGGKLAFALNAMPLIGRDTDYDDIHHNDNASKTNNDKRNGDEKDENNSIMEGGVWYATGFAGHGIVPTTLAGSLLANAILGVPHRKEEYHLFQTYFPPCSWNGAPCSRMCVGMVLMGYNFWDWLGKKLGVTLPSLPKLW
eukprot:CAMPEP_0183716746 /NCGR_PEP_ID=MMETSP0737-20130205/10530_1 /TAXON_ID=385413 /ORGANISM="Thalassiosira miniscula, Strain CCMP1093" /LENGTH=741 /DNA_ID=CAMNT_0025946045 /DNA_START=63 /DNA_END=2285 /DNA_ORIENTATION=+